MRKATGLGGGALIAAALIAGMVQAQEPAKRPANDQPVLVELFLSQSCSSCVAAAAFFTEIAKRDNVVALGWHVDYWNSLNTSRGRWSDPFSDKAYTDRQRSYNKSIRRRSSVYTPQIVVSGAQEAIGSERDAVNELINAAYMTYKPISIRAGQTPNQVVFDLSDTTQSGNIFLVTFQPAAETFVRRGENADIKFNDVNIVTNIIKIGALTQNRERITAPKPVDGLNCALIVQEPDQGKVLAASYCATN